MEVKFCNRCGFHKPLNEFHYRNKAKNTRNSECKSCMKERNRNWYNAADHRRKALKKKYGISLEDYDKMLEEQEHGCKICGSKKSHMKHSDYLCVDHCHTTGKVRGLLCSKCNSAIGLLDEDTNRMRLAIQYLRAA